jgi:hypothetical protein
VECGAVPLSRKKAVGLGPISSLLSFLLASLLPCLLVGQGVFTAKHTRIQGITTRNQPSSSERYHECAHSPRPFPLACMRRFWRSAFAQGATGFSREGTLARFTAQHWVVSAGARFPSHRTQDSTPSVTSFVAVRSRGRVDRERSVYPLDSECEAEAARIYEVYGRGMM